jgi:hypothetical protein
MAAAGAVRPRASPPARRTAPGLTTAQARERLAKVGPNVLAKAEVTPWWRAFA